MRSVGLISFSLFFPIRAVSFYFLILLPILGLYPAGLVLSPGWLCSSPLMKTILGWSMRWSIAGV